MKPRAKTSDNRVPAASPSAAAAKVTITMVPEACMPSGVRNLSRSVATAMTMAPARATSKFPPATIDHSGGHQAGPGECRGHALVPRGRRSEAAIGLW